MSVGASTRPLRSGCEKKRRARAAHHPQIATTGWATTHSTTSFGTLRNSGTRRATSRSSLVPIKALYGSLVDGPRLSAELKQARVIGVGSVCSPLYFTGSLGATHK